jgi:hypothetical protein
VLARTFLRVMKRSISAVINCWYRTFWEDAFFDYLLLLNYSI